MGGEGSLEESIQFSLLKAEKRSNKLERELKYLKSLIKAQNKYISELKAVLDQKGDISIGNEGVQAINQAINQQAFLEQIFNVELRGVPKHVSDPFRTLTSREFVVFLTIYQLEDEKGFATYTDIAKKLGLSNSCIRGYISSAIQKGAHILRQKPNNKAVILRIQPYFRKYGLKKRLINIYYRKDPDQLTLTS